MATDAAFTRFPTLETERLLLREIRHSDANDLFEVFSDPVAMQYYGSPAHTSPDDTHAWIDRVQARYAAREALRWGVTLKSSDDQLIGTCSLHHFGPGRAETGYDLNRAYWGRGIMTEAMRAVLTYVFDVLELHRVEAMIDIQNEASKALLLKLGFTYEGNLRERFPEADGYSDEHYFGLLRREWKPA
jgi:ribosomal-protein-alanine N-acetyltransferase